MVLDIRHLCKQKLKINYPIDIQFYSNELPALNYDDLISLTRERIKVLKIITAVTRDNRGKSNEYVRPLIVERLKNIQSYVYATLLDSKGHQTSSDEDIMNRLIDHASFMTLSLSLIPTHQHYEDLQRIEEKFFKLRISALDHEGLRNVLDRYNEFPKINEREKQKLKPKLLKFLQNPDSFNEVEFFKVPISYILGMINPHEVHFHQGLAFIPFYMIEELLCAQFRHCLKKRISFLDIISLKSLEKFFDTFRIICNYVRATFIQMQQSALSDSEITAEDIDDLSETAFPPCMRIVHQSLRKNHHLKHESRLQLTLFLKGIGLPVNEALKLFKDEFTQRMDDELFEKEYKYYIEHAYGLRGSRIDWEPKDCKEIQETPTSAGDCNGCPLQVTHITDIEDLDKTLSQWKIPNSDKCDIIEESKNGNAGTACARYFQVVNSCRMNLSVEHPNDFFTHSRYAQNYCLSELPYGDEETNLNSSYLDISTMETEITTDNAENFVKDECVNSENSTEVECVDSANLTEDECVNSENSTEVECVDSANLTEDEYVNSENPTEDEIEAGVAYDIKKRKADMAFDDDETEVPDVNKRVKTNSIDVIEELDGDESPTSELISRVELMSTQEHNISVSIQGESSSYTPPLIPSKLLLDLTEEAEKELELIKCLALEFDQIIPIETIKTGSIINTPRIYAPRKNE